MDSEDLDEVHTEVSAEEEDEEVEEEGAERASQPPQQDPEPQSAVGESPAEAAPAPLPTAPAGQVSAASALVSCQLCRPCPVRATLWRSVHQEQGSGRPLPIALVHPGSRPAYLSLNRQNTTLPDKLKYIWDTSDMGFGS